MNYKNKYERTFACTVNSSSATKILFKIIDMYLRHLISNVEKQVVVVPNIFLINYLARRL